MMRAIGAPTTEFTAPRIAASEIVSHTPTAIRTLTATAILTDKTAVEILTDATGIRMPTGATVACIKTPIRADMIRMASMVRIADKPHYQLNKDEGRS